MNLNFTFVKFKFIILLNSNCYLFHLSETAPSKRTPSIFITKILSIVKILTLIGLLVSLALPYAQAQAVLNTTGATIIGSALVVEYSVGEVAIATIGNREQNAVTQGLLQPLTTRIPWVVTDTDDAFTAQYGFRAYPNPTTESISVETNYTDFDAYQIMDVSGKVIQVQRFDYTAIPVATLSNGMYVVKLFSKDKLLTKSFKVIKQ